MGRLVERDRWKEDEAEYDADTCDVEWNEGKGFVIPDSECVVCV